MSLFRLVLTLGVSLALLCPLVWAESLPSKLQSVQLTISPTDWIISDVADQPTDQAALYLKKSETMDDATEAVRVRYLVSDKPSNAVDFAKKYLLFAGKLPSHLMTYPESQFRFIKKAPEEAIVKYTTYDSSPQGPQNNMVVTELMRIVQLEPGQFYLYSYLQSGRLSSADEKHWVTTLTTIRH